MYLIACAKKISMQLTATDGGLSIKQLDTVATATAAVAGRSKTIIKCRFDSIRLIPIR